MSYSHRNGETTPPTELPGWYFCYMKSYDERINMRRGLAYITLPEWNIQDDPIFVLDGEWWSFRRAIACWWGPVEVPWHSEGEDGLLG